MKLHASGEDYLEAVLMIQKEKGMARSVLVDVGIEDVVVEQEAYRMDNTVSQESFEKIQEVHRKYYDDGSAPNIGSN